MAFDFSYPNAPADQRGWGPGAPNCQESKMVPVGYPSFSPGALCRKEIQPLVHMLLTETEETLGYALTPGVLDDWAFSCRMTKDSSGNLTNTPSNHSWGLAFDLNATRNVFGGGHDMPQDVVDLWHRYGFRYLGPPIHDWMHFDFAGTPADALAMTDKARADGIGMALTDEQKQTLTQAAAFLDAVKTATGAATLAGAGARVGRATVKVENGGTSEPVLVAHHHDEGRTGPAVKDA